MERARSRGFLGPPPIEDHLGHAEAFATAWVAGGGGGGGPEQAADLGSGGGIPALPLALRWSDSRWLLIEAAERRGAFLAEAIATLGLDDRVVVRRARAEEVGRDPDVRERFVLVTARSFGPPAVTAECAAPLLTRGGLLVVSEPPSGAAQRWPPAGVGMVGLVNCSAVVGPPAFRILRQETACPATYPRRVGIPAKRPLW